MEDKFGTLQQNGYVSKTLRTVHIGQKGRLEWIGEELCDSTFTSFPYSAIAYTKCVTFMIKQSDFNKIPMRIREELSKHG